MAANKPTHSTDKGLRISMTKDFKQQIENNFTYHPPNELQIEKYQAIRNLSKALAHFINETCPDSREKSLAIANLEQAMMWANASIARNE